MHRLTYLIILMILSTKSMSALEINIQALRELYPNVNFGYFIEKPVSIKYLITKESGNW